MRAATFFLLLAVIGVSQFAEAQNRVVIAVSTALDGKGNVLHASRIVVSGSKIVAIDRNASPIDYDLRGLTVMPGWIDAHVHITSRRASDRMARTLAWTSPHRKRHIALPRMLTLRCLAASPQSRAWTAV